MEHILILSLAFNTVRSQCTDGSFSWLTVNGVSECHYYDNCEQKWVFQDQISFDLVLKKCPAVKLVNEMMPSHCNSTADLVYPNSGGCFCPSCKCPSVAAELHEVVSYDGEIGPEATCYNCTCRQNWNTYVQNELTLVCGEVSSASDPFEWQDYSCPPGECGSLSAGTSTRSCELNFNTGKYDRTQSYCSDDGLASVTGNWEDVLANDELTESTWHDCVNVIQTTNNPVPSVAVTILLCLFICHNLCHNLCHNHIDIWQNYIDTIYSVGMRKLSHIMFHE